MARFQDILAHASRLSCIDVAVLTGKQRYKPITIVRAAAWTVGIEHGHGYAPMGRVMHKDHSSAIHAVKEGMPDYLAADKYGELGIGLFLSDLRKASTGKAAEAPLWYPWKVRARAWGRYEFLYMAPNEMRKCRFALRQPKAEEIRVIRIREPEITEPAFCGQCDRMVKPAEALACRSQYCKAA